MHSRFTQREWKLENRIPVLGKMENERELVIAISGNQKERDFILKCPT